MNEQAGVDTSRIISPFWTAQEAADYCRVSKHTMHHLCRIKAIKARMVGNQWRVAKRDLDAYLERDGEVGVRHG